MLKNQEIKMRKKGSNVTNFNHSKANGISNIRTADDKQPNSHLGLSSNPGGAIICPDSNHFDFLFNSLKLKDPKTLFS